MIPRRRGGAVLAALALCLGCSRKDTPSVVCPRTEAAFRLQLTTSGALPPDTSVEVTYGGSQTDTFDLAKPGHHEDVCCRVADPTSGALPAVPCEGVSQASSAVGTEGGASDASAARDGGPPPRDAGSDAALADSGGSPVDAGVPGKPMALQCELWTNGSAHLRISATGYVPHEEDLVSKIRDDHCGVRTIDVRVALVRPDGG